MSNEEGVTGGSPAPSGGNEGSPASTTGVNTSSSPTTSQSAPASKSSQFATKMRSNASPDLSDDELWDKYGDRIFKHERFKELHGFKKKYESVEPYQKFVDEIGGLENLQEFNRFFGPVWQKLAENPEAGQQFWSKIYPALSSFISGQDYNSHFAQVVAAAAEAQAHSEIENDPYAEKLKPIQSEVENLKKQLAQAQSENQVRNQREREQFRQGTLQQYLSLVDKRIAASAGAIPEDMKREIAEIMGPRIAAYMPKNRGQQVHPLDFFSEEAFNSCWESVIDPLVKRISGAALGKAKTVINNGGPALPNTNTFGKSPVGAGVPASMQDKKARMIQMLRSSAASE